MSLLRHYPISTLKIDRAFVLDCHASASSRALVSALIDVGHALNLQVVAEGVETEAQRAVLAELGCDAMQGFLFSKALSPKEVSEFSQRLATGRSTPRRLTSNLFTSVSAIVGWQDRYRPLRSYPRSLLPGSRVAVQRS